MLTKKVVFDALVYNPIWACGFIVIMALLRNESKEEIKAELKRDWLDLYVSNIIFWVPLNFVVYGAFLSIYASQAFMDSPFYTSADCLCGKKIETKSYRRWR